MQAAPDSVRRARPLLGTFVEISVAHADGAAALRALEAAFRAVATVHRLMSFHDPESDVGRLNRAAIGAAVPVHPWTWRVLATAVELHQRSQGMFDVAVAPVLQDLGLLPRAATYGSSSPERGGSDRCWQRSGEGSPSTRGARVTRLATPSRRASRVDPRVDARGQAHPLSRGGEDQAPVFNSDRPAVSGGGLCLLPGARVRFLHPGLRIDLGGIAKGFAVDRAIAVLRRHGIARGLVNAGGDLAAFGTGGETIGIRDPRDARCLLGHVRIADEALASSGARREGARGDGARSADFARAAVIDPRTRATACTALGATVRAPSCMIADALTKVVMLDAERSVALLDHYGASALRVDAGGEIRVTSGWQDALARAA